MSFKDDTPLGGMDDPRAQLRHDLLTPVTVIAVRAGLLERIVRRSEAMPDAERASLLAGAAAIQAAVLAVRAVVDGLDARRGDPFA